MLTPQDWKDYTLLDVGDGEKLEKWGEIITIRPDPQAIWPRITPDAWKTPHMYYHRSKSGGGRWEIMRPTPEAWDISYCDLRFHIRPTGFKHMGLFPEQAVNWQWMIEKIETAAQPIKVLNLFAYTGGATVACLSAGASVVHIDAAKGMNAWAKDNITLSGLGDTKHRIMADDVLKFVQREGRRGNRYHGIIMDPPVFGRGPKGELWKLEDKLHELVTAAMSILEDDPLFFLINAYTAGLSPAVYGNILSMVMTKHPGKTMFGEVGLQARNDILLPCGMYARWEKL
ncbi:MAG: class I SAM-dependent methyltransferase [Defluviitaleaceae bacterium]|nr:class I SAM-dependent methyltransferase [Defluviitaleaceae bacterium]